MITSCNKESKKTSSLSIAYEHITEKKEKRKKEVKAYIGSAHGLFTSMLQTQN